MELSALRKEALDQLTKDALGNISKYAGQETPWVEEYFAEHEIKKPFFNAEIEIEPVELIPGNEAANDSENAVLLHSALKGKMNPTQAVDRRLWVAASHTIFYKYMRSRWPVEDVLNEKGTNGTVTDRYFAKRGLFRNGISRLYWIADMTYDQSLADPYEYTRFFMSSQELVNQIEGSAPCRNRSILKAVLKVLKEAGTTSDIQKRRYLEAINKRGGVKVLDALSPELMEAVCRSALDEAMNVKQIANGSKVLLQALTTGMKLRIEVKEGKAYSGKTLFKTKPQNLYRLSIGKEIEIGKISYRIIDII